MIKGKLAITVAAGLLATGAPAIAKSIEQELAACRALPTSEVRVTCYDRLADEVARGRVQAQAAPAAPPPPQTSSVVRSAQKPQSAQSAEVQAPQPAAPAQQATVATTSHQTPTTQQAESRSIWSRVLSPGNDGVTAAIASVERIERGRVRMVTADGMIWEQSEDFRIREWPSPGDEVTVSRSTFGYWCRLSRRDLFHCVPRKTQD